MDKSVLKDLSYGVYIISAKEENNLVGCVVNSVKEWYGYESKFN